MGDAESNITSVDGIAITSEPVGYAAAELVECPKCGRANSPDRFACLYCAAALPSTEIRNASATIKPGVAEAWERGFNVVLLGVDGGVAMEDVLASVALDEEALRSVTDLEPPLPLMRVGKENEASEISMRLGELGVRTAVVPDAVLIDSVPKRARAVEFDTDAIVFTSFGSGERDSVAVRELRLLVTGTIFEKRSESTVIKKRRSISFENETTTMTDFGVIDIYDGTAGWRIATNGFDFSCLGADKALVAGENLRRLIAKFADLYPTISVDEQYRQNSKLLDSIWPLTISNDSKGLQRIGFKVERSKGEIATNIDQFTKYSRLRAMFV